MSENNNLNYKDAGVNIDNGNTLVEDIKTIVKKTTRPEVLGSIGGFAGLCEIPTKYQQPVLVSSTDGVGTKLKLAMACERHEVVGIDLVAMCVNDLLASGAEPLFFLDYFATGKLDINLAKTVIAGIGKGCQLSNCALIGGETAEMPGMYHNQDYDIAGFCVGVVEKSQILTNSKVANGDILIGLKSSGPHANGYSLIRKILANNSLSLDYKLAGKNLADWLLEPTKIYVKTILKLLENNAIHALSHITGGGFIENLPRVFNNNLQAVIDLNSWKTPEIFTFLQQQGNITTTEMYRVFNCGIGMVLFTTTDNCNDTLKLLAEMGEDAVVLGKVSPREDNIAVTFIG